MVKGGRERSIKENKPHKIKIKKTQLRKQQNQIFNKLQFRLI